MFETTRNYTDERYCRKSEVAQDFQYIMVEPIWQEIEKYRSLFRWEIPFAKDYFITRNALINDRINELSELLYACSYENRDQHVVWESDTNILSQAQICATERFVHHMQLHPIQDYNQAFLRYLRDCELPLVVDKVKVDALLNREVSIVIRIFMAIEFFEKPLAYAIVIFLLGSQKLLYPLTFLPLSKIFDDTIALPVEYDLTYKLFTFINNSRLNLSLQVVSLCRNARKDVRILSKQELLERYPMLCEHQIDFYLTHHKTDHYYTIKDYQDTNQVCYETARYSLDAMVTQNWYRKQRIGKKFMYYVV